MFKLRHLKGNTYYLSCFSNCGVYDLGGGEAVLIDSCDHKKSVTDLDRQLEAMGLRVKAIYNTHGHIDHVYGNDYFTSKYGCSVYAFGMERALAQNPCIEGTYFFTTMKAPRTEDGYYGYVEPDGKTSYFNVPTEFLTKETLPDGFDFIRLPGHSFDMVGIKTPDDVWFLGDAVIAPELFESYHFPLFMFPNAAIRTLRTVLPDLAGDIFVPAHVRPLEDIREICEENAKGIESAKEYIRSLCRGSSFEDIFKKADEDFGLQITPDRYAKMSVMVKALITSLVDDGKVRADFIDGRMCFSAANGL